MINSASHQPDKYRGNPPVFLTPLLGREQDVAQVYALLQRSEVRVLTLVGPGGVGKTRLGLAASLRLCALFKDGVCFVSLAPTSDPQLVLPALAQQLEVKEAVGQSVLSSLTAALQDRCLLLLLDNMEQIVAAAPLLAELLAGCPHLKLLITSRAVLRMDGEHLFTVAPLALPDLTQLPDQETLAQQAAVALFLQRAQAMQPDFLLTAANARAVAQICVRLDGLPLAIELAAARIRLLQPYALQARLAQRFSLLTRGSTTLPERQQTLRDTLQWSYNLLEAHEQGLFRLLSIFVGDFMLEAAEGVCNLFWREGRDASASVLDGVDSLLEKSFLHQVQRQRGEPRLAMLETIREYGQEMLTNTGENEQARQAHAEYYLFLAEQAAPQLQRAEQVDWLTRLDLEHENLRSALNWLLERAQVEGIPQAERVLRLCNALHPFWWTRGYLREGWTFLERALMVREGAGTLAQARLLLAAVSYALHLQDLERAEIYGQESLALFREEEETDGMADSLYRLGLIARMRFQFPPARAFLQEGIELSRKGNDMRGSILFLTEQAIAFVHQGKYSQAITLLEENVVEVRESENVSLIAWILFCLAYVLLLSKADSARIHPLLAESMALYKTLEDQWHIAYVFCIQGETHLAQGETTVARTRIEESLTIFQEIGTWWELSEVRLSLARVYAAQGDFAASQLLSQENLAASRKRNHKPHIAPCLEGVARSIAAQGDILRAARLWGAAEALREALGAPIPRIYRAVLEQAVGQARDRAGEEAFARAWAEGRTLPLEQILADREPTLSPAQAVKPPHVSPVPPAGLTPRELDVLRLLAQGLTSAQIAEQLVISLVTVNFHVRSIYSKLGVSSRSAATRYAIENHLT